MLGSGWRRPRGDTDTSEDLRRASASARGGHVLRRKLLVECARFGGTHAASCRTSVSGEDGGPCPSGEKNEGYDGARFRAHEDRTGHAVRAEEPVARVGELQKALQCAPLSGCAPPGLHESTHTHSVIVTISHAGKNEKAREQKRRKGKRENQEKRKDWDKENVQGAARTTR